MTSGIDIHIYANHPDYIAHIHRVDSYANYRRILLLLSLLFVEDDSYFDLSESNEELEELSNDMEERALQLQEPQPQEKQEQKLVNPNQWFLSKLMDMDAALFRFQTAKSGKTSDNGYSRMCTAVDNRQPAVITQDQYDRMRTIYEQDPIFWIIYPLEGDKDPVQPLGTEETITIMRYGSDADKVHYYFCPQYYCLSDEIMIRPVDWEAAVDRDGNAKPANSCPFCHGTLITNTKHAELGKTVIQRNKSVQSTTFPRHIKFLKKSTHPAGLSLPCCFVTPTALRVEDESFSHLKDVFQQRKVEEPEDAEDIQHLVFRSKESIEYGVLLEMIHREYILESNKRPDPGIFAAAPAALDEFFKQNSLEDIVTRVRIHLKLRPNAQGFLRLGTENTLNESLLGALAPIIYRNSIDEVKQRILEVVVPRIFVHANFGNLVLEFYKPADAYAMPATRQELQLWAQTNLQIAMNSTNYQALLRIFNAYHRFIRFVQDPAQRKDLRHFQALLAEPGLFTARGVQLIILNDTMPVSIQCPAFGVSMDRHKKNDMVFLSRSMRSQGSATQQPYAHYELYIHTSNKPARGAEVEVHEPIVRWDYASYRVWPRIVQTRVDEYLQQCQSRYRSLYTLQDDVPTMSMIPLSMTLRAPSRPEGIVKDSYNHIVGVTFRSKPGSSSMVILPVVDDGILTISTAFSIPSIYLDIDDIRLAPVEDVIAYYGRLEPLFYLYEGYHIQHLVRRKEQGGKIIAIQLKNGVYVPVGPPKKEEPNLPVVELAEFQWEMDQQIAAPAEEKVEHQITAADLEEGYQQFRMMVSNWLMSPQAGGEIRKAVEEIIFASTLPEYERRKRLFLYLSSTLLSWFHADDDAPDREGSFLRKDCRVIDSKDACTGSCYWKQDENRCLLHVHATTALSEQKGHRDVSTPMMMTKRVIDELVRFPGRRKQLMDQGVSSISKIVKPIHQGDQYIIPESSPTWTSLLRMDWLQQTPEKPRYIEEMSGVESEVPVAAQGNQPPEFQEILGDLRIKWLPASDPPLLPLTALLGMTMEQLSLENEEFGRNAMIQYVRLTGKPIGVFHPDAETPLQFAKPAGFFSSVMMIVFYGGRVGLIMEEENKETITMAKATPILQDRWAEAGIVQTKKKPTAGVIPPAPLVAAKAAEAPPPMTMKRKPQAGISTVSRMDQ